MFFLDPLNGGAWPLLVGGVICLVDSVNGRDPSRLVGTKIHQRQQSLAWLRLTGVTFGWFLLCGIPGFAPGEILGNSRSVMLLNVLGDTRTTMSVRTRIEITSCPLYSMQGGNTGITSTQLGPRIAIIGRVTRNIS